MTTAPVVELLASDINPEAISRVSDNRLGSVPDVIQSGLMSHRLLVINYVKEQVAKEKEVSATRLMQLMDQASALFLGRLNTVIGPVAAEAYLRAYREVGAGNVPMTTIYALADQHTRRIAQYYDDTSRDALLQGFNSYVNRQVPLRVAADRALDAYGLTPRQMNGYVALEGQQKVTSAQPPRSLKAKALEYIGRSIRSRLKIFAKQEAHNLDLQAKQTAWMWMQDQGVLSERAQKTWLTAKDEKTCKTCGPLHGKKVGVSERFKLPDGSLVWVPGPHPNCRCTVKVTDPGVFGKADTWDTDEQVRNSLGQFSRTREKMTTDVFGKPIVPMEGRKERTEVAAAVDPKTATALRAERYAQSKGAEEYWRRNPTVKGGLKARPDLNKVDFSALPLSSDEVATVKNAYATAFMLPTHEERVARVEEVTRLAESLVRAKGLENTLKEQRKATPAPVLAPQPSLELPVRVKAPPAPTPAPILAPMLSAPAVDVPPLLTEAVAAPQRDPVVVQHIREERFALPERTGALPLLETPSLALPERTSLALPERNQLALPERTKFRVTKETAIRLLHPEGAHAYTVLQASELSDDGHYQFADDTFQLGFRQAIDKAAALREQRKQHFVRKYSGTYSHDVVFMPKNDPVLRPMEAHITAEELEHVIDVLSAKATKQGADDPHLDDPFDVRLYPMGTGIRDEEHYDFDAQGKDYNYTADHDTITTQPMTAAEIGDRLGIGPDTFDYKVIALNTVHDEAADKPRGYAQHNPTSRYADEEHWSVTGEYAEVLRVPERPGKGMPAIDVIEVEPFDPTSRYVARRNIND